MVEMAISIREKVRTVTLETILAAICFLAGLAFLVAAILGLWRHFFTMGLCFAIGVMISDNPSRHSVKKKRHKED